MVSEGVNDSFSSHTGCEYYLLSSLERVLVLDWIKHKQRSRGMIHNQTEDGTTIFYIGFKN